MPLNSIGMPIFSIYKLIKPRIMSEENKKISLNTAIAWAENWREVESGYNEYNKCRGFLVPAQDLVAVLKEISDQPYPSYIRAYLGVELLIVEGKMVSEEKLMIVGTEKAIDPVTEKTYYKDLLPNDRTSDLGDDGGSIWDFTDPCPPDCDPNSALNG